MSELDYCKQRVFHVKDKKTGNIWDCIPEMRSVNFDGKMSLCYFIGVYNYQGWHMICREYDNKSFNERYEVIE